MSKVDEMFKELGYEKRVENDNIIYTHNRNRYKEFVFLTKNKDVELLNINLLSTRKLQAINEKVKELRLDRRRR